MFKKGKAKLKAIQLAPQIMEKAGKHSKKKKETLKKNLVASYKEAKDLNDQGKLDDAKADEMYIEQSALAMAYFQKDGRPPKPFEVNKLMNECAAEAGIELQEE